MKQVARSPLSRNLWAIMDKFNVLPSNPDVQNLTDMQIAWIMENMSRDAELTNMQRKGMDVSNMHESADSSWWDKHANEFDPTDGLQEGEEERLAAQVEALTAEKDNHRLAKISEDTDAWAEFLENGGEDIRELETDNIIQKNFEDALEEAKRLEAQGVDKSKSRKEPVSPEEQEASQEFTPMTQESLDEAIALFEGKDKEDTDADNQDNNDDFYTGSPDDGFI